MGGEGEEKEKKEKKSEKKGRIRLNLLLLFLSNNQTAAELLLNPVIHRLRHYQTTPPSAHELFRRGSKTVNAGIAESAAAVLYVW